MDDDARRGGFDACIDALTMGETQRVWSFIVSILGDFLQSDQHLMSGAALTKVTEAVGIKPQAMRVALHRLRKDGWVESRRNGRASVHFLTEFGRHQSAEAGRRIYAASPQVPDGTHVLISGSSGAEGFGTLEQLALTRNYVALGDNVLLGFGPLPRDLRDIVAFEAGDAVIPDWLKLRVCPPELIEKYTQLLNALTFVERELDAGPHLSLLETTALRALVVHRWRRVLLGHADLPESLLPDGWTGAECRQRVLRILGKLPQPDVEELGASLDPGAGSEPAG